MSPSSTTPEPRGDASPVENPPRIRMDVCRDGWTNGLQLGISALDENGAGHGYRLAGPKYNGSQKQLLSTDLTERDAREIREYLDLAFPVESETELRAEVEKLRGEVIAAEADTPWGRRAERQVDELTADLIRLAELAEQGDVAALRREAMNLGRPARFVSGSDFAEGGGSDA